jgi:hypothetical protein
MAYIAILITCSVVGILLQKLKGGPGARWAAITATVLLPTWLGGSVVAILLEGSAFARGFPWFPLTTTVSVTVLLVIVVAWRWTSEPRTVAVQDGGLRDVLCACGGVYWTTSDVATSDVMIPCPHCHRVCETTRIADGSLSVGFAGWRGLTRSIITVTGDRIHAQAVERNGRLGERRVIATVNAQPAQTQEQPGAVPGGAEAERAGGREC